MKTDEQIDAEIRKGILSVSLFGLLRIGSAERIIYREMYKFGYKDAQVDFEQARRKAASDEGQGKQ